MKLLILLSRVPYPLEKGDKLRAFNHIRYLSKHYEITLVALNDEKLHPAAISTLEKYCKEIHIISLSKFTIFSNLIKAVFTRNPFSVAYFYSWRIKNKIIQIIENTSPDHIFCQLIRVSEYVKYVNIPKTLDYQDVFSKGMDRRLNASPWFLKPLFRVEYKRLLNYERYIFDYFDFKLIISEADKKFIDHPLKNQIHVVSNGVDTKYFQQFDEEKEFDLLFTGNMNYPPNINCVSFLVKDILPDILKVKPNVRLLIAGTNPSHQVLSLQSANVEVSGWVEDMRQCYAKSRIFIAPMLIGTGLQNKLLEAMAMQLPCVTSSLANSSLHAEENKEILIGIQISDYVNHVLHLLNNPVKANEIAMNGLKFIERNYNWEKHTDKIYQLITHK